MKYSLKPKTNLLYFQNLNSTPIKRTKKKYMYNVVILSKVLQSFYKILDAI